MISEYGDRLVGDWWTVYRRTRMDGFVVEGGVGAVRLVKTIQDVCYDRCVSLFLSNLFFFAHAHVRSSPDLETIPPLVKEFMLAFALAHRSNGQIPEDQTHLVLFAMKNFKCIEPAQLERPPYDIPSLPFNGASMVVYFGEALKAVRSHRSWLSVYVSTHQASLVVFIDFLCSMTVYRSYCGFKSTTHKASKYSLPKSTDST